MNLTIIAEQLHQPNTGIGRYTHGVVRDAVAEPGLTLTILTTGDGVEIAEEMGVSTGSVHVIPGPVMWRSMRILAGSVRGIRRADVVFATKHFVPPSKRASTVLSVFDLVALDRRANLKSVGLRAGYLSSLRRADVLAPINLELEKALAQVLEPHVPATVPYLPTLPVAVRSVRPSLVPNRPFVLHVSDLNRRKNLGVVLSRWRDVHRLTGAQLVAVGARHAESAWREELAALASEGVALDLGPVEEGQLAWLYDFAELLVLPSTVEGLGYPVLEAARAGCPVLCTEVPALAMCPPGTATVLPANDELRWLNAIVSHLANPRGERQRLVPVGIGSFAELIFAAQRRQPGT